MRGGRACAGESSWEASGTTLPAADPRSSRGRRTTGVGALFRVGHPGVAMTIATDAPNAPAGTGEFAPLTVGPLTVWPPVVLAPMAGITNAPFRALCRTHGAGLYFREMIHVPRRRRGP